MSATSPTHNNPTPQPMLRRMPLIAWLFLAASVLIVLLWFLAARGYWEDDAYIHLEFARSLAAGHGFTFNNHLVYGDTSPLWVWLLIAAHLFVPDWLSAGKFLTVIAAAFALSGIFFFARSLVRRWWHPAAAEVFAATMLLTFVLSPYFGYWAFSGMEALAAAGLACWTCLFLAHRHLTWPRVMLAALLAGLAPLLRPEMAFFTLLVCCVLLQRIRNMHASVVTRVDTFLAALVLAAAPAVSWAFYARRTFGSVLPNTNAAKRAGPADSVLTRLVHLYGFGYPVTLLALLVVATLTAVYYTRRHKHPAHTSPYTALHAGGWLLFVWTAFNTIFYIADHTLVQTRYIFVTAPLLTIATLALAAVRWPRVYQVLLTLTLLYSAAVSLFITRPLVHNKVVVNATYADLAAYMRSLPPQSPVALYAIGEPAFLSQHPIIDTGGITRPGVVPYIHDAGDARLTAWIYAQGAKYEVIDHAPLPGAQLLWSRSLPATGWYLQPSRYATTQRLQLWELPPAPDTIATSNQ